MLYGSYWKAAVVMGLLVLTCCSSESTQPAKKAEAAQPAVADLVTAKTAFWAMYKSAHTWAADLTPLAVESKEIPGIKNSSGKAAIWRATFGSPSKREARVYSYAVAAHPPDILKGITVGNGQPWNGPVPKALPIDTSDFATDSDAAYQTALKQASAWASKSPDQEVSFRLGNASRFPAPVWYVLWGNEKSGHAVYVNAKTGALVK